VAAVVLVFAVAVVAAAPVDGISGGLTRRLFSVTIYVL